MPTNLEMLRRMKSAAPEPEINGDDGLPDDSGNWTIDIPPEGMERATGHAIRRGDPSPTEANALDWESLYERGEPPPRRWAEQGWFGFGHVTLLVGSGGIGKTLIAQQWASSFAVGERLVNEPAGPLRTLMWCCEDDHDELWRRQLAIATWQRKSLRDYGNLTLIPRAGLSNALVTSEFGRPMFTPLIETLRAQAEATQADVVILDNVAQLYGAGENDRHAVTFFMNGLTGALQGRAVLLLAHPSKGVGSEFSGSTAWEASARTRLYLGNKLPDEKQDDEAQDGAVRYLCRRKANYSGKDYRRFTYEAGVLIPDSTDLSGGIFDRAHDRQAERAILDALRKLTRLGKFPNDSANSPNYLPKLMLGAGIAQGFGRAELAKALGRLFISETVIICEIGKTADRHPIIGLKEKEI